MTKLCPRGKAAAKRKFKVYPSAYANAYASKICAGKAKDPSGVKRKDWGPKKKKDGGEINYGKQPKDKMKTKPYGIEDRKIKIEKLLSREDSEILRKEKGIGLYASPSKSYSGLYPSPKKKKDGGEMKINKVIKGLRKASRTHAAQAKTLETVKKADGGMIDMTKMKYV